MSTNRNSLKEEAQRMLDTLAFMPFEQCQPINRQFNHIPNRPGLYAVRHRDQGLLYIGKSKNLRSRFSGGHKAFLWAWLDKYGDNDVRLAIRTLTAWEDPALLLELEAIILRATEPPYNVQIPPES
jgi:excinuclease UvrABC nuclease subunit